jgi:hypothetical protein
MAEQRWHPWKLMGIAMALVAASGLVTGLVRANWSTPEPVPVARTTPTIPSVPSPAAIAACNEQAAKVGRQDKTIEVVKNAASLYGLDENRKNDEHYRGAYAACMRTRGASG